MAGHARAAPRVPDRPVHPGSRREPPCGGAAVDDHGNNSPPQPGAPALGPEQGHLQGDFAARSHDQREICGSDTGGAGAAGVRVPRAGGQGEDDHKDIRPGPREREETPRKAERHGKLL